VVSKRLGMQRSATFSLVLAPPLGFFAKVVRPVIWLLSVSTNFVVRLLGGDPIASGEEMTIEEVREIVEGHQGLRPYSRAIMTDVFRAHERNVDRVMRPRTDVEFLAGDQTVQEAHALMLPSTHSRFPVKGRSVDDIIGF